MPARVPAIVTRRLVPSPFLIFDPILKGIMGKNTVNQRKQPDDLIERGGFFPPYNSMDLRLRC